MVSLMTDAEKREAARQFYQKWHDRGREDEDNRSYWLDILSGLWEPATLLTV